MLRGLKFGTLSVCCKSKSEVDLWEMPRWIFGNFTNVSRREKRKTVVSFSQLPFLIIITTEEFSI
jgi:hypothetical protein